MGKKLAIKGHSTRGKEVIELLKMIGGSNIHNLLGCNDYVYYVNDNDQNIIRSSKIFNSEDVQCFTLEEFLEKYPFKVGDKVIIDGYNYLLLIIAMQWDDNTVKYLVSDDNNCNLWYTAEDIESMRKIVKTNFMQLGKTTTVCFNKENYENEVELQLGDYKIEVRDGRTYAVRKKPKYPTTYEECCKNYPDNEKLKIGNLLCDLEQLIICRNAYWKIAGEEMGLGKPWKPNEDSIIAQYGIRPLLFPSKEIYNMFYDNFKELIEQCKELL